MWKFATVLQRAAVSAQAGSGGQTWGEAGPQTLPGTHTDTSGWVCRAAAAAGPGKASSQPIEQRTKVEGLRVDAQGGKVDLIGACPGVQIVGDEHDGGAAVQGVHGSLGWLGLG